MEMLKLLGGILIGLFTNFIYDSIKPYFRKFIIYLRSSWNSYWYYIISNIKSYCERQESMKESESLNSSATKKSLNLDENPFLEIIKKDQFKEEN